MASPKLFLAVLAPALIALFLCLASLKTVHASKILSVAFVSSKSHKITYEPLLYELAARGHNVTILAPFVSGKAQTNVREIQTISWDEDQADDAFERKLRGEPILNAFSLDRLYEACAQTYDAPHVRALLDEKFDLVFVSALLNECTSGFVYKLNTSVIQISPISVPGHIATVFGNPSPTSFVPHTLTPFRDSMTIWQRTVNFLVDTIFDAYVFYYFQPSVAKLYREKLGDPSIPLHNEIMRNASLILSNSHLSLSKPRPFLPDVVEVGGMHCRPAKPLPQELKTFLDSSGEDGFIFFSMGSILKASQLPDNYRQIFIRVFGRLKQKVLWKWDTDHMDGLPANVKLSNWLPQQDVLGHPKIRAFITHGGLGGTTEAAYHGVPLVGIPILGDQYTNLEKAEASGLAVVLDLTTLTEEKLFNAINEVLTVPSYAENARKLSQIFRDQPDKPLDRAVFWTEYVIRHGGAVHLRSAARDLNGVAYHSIDVIVTLAVLLVAIIYMTFALIRCFIRLLCGRCSGRLPENSSNFVSKAKVKAKKVN